MYKMKIELSLLALCLGMMPLGSAKATGVDCGVPQLAACPEPVDATLLDVKNMLTWDQQQRVVGFRNDYRSYPGDVFKAAKAEPIPASSRDLSTATYTYHGQTYTLQDYLKRNNVTGMMVIKDGKVAWDFYNNGNTRTTLWTSRSVGKSVVSTLVGIALKEGKIASLNDKIVKYNPDVKGTAWAKVSVQQLLQHTSGVTWNEDYANPKSDFAQLTQCEANPGTTYECVNKLVINPQRKAYAKPGKVWSYSSGGAWLLGDTLEDWGKFGLFVMNDGVLPDGGKALPTNWVANARKWNKARNSVSAAHPEGSYGYQWWNNSVPHNAMDVSPKQGLSSKDTLWALGIYGQMIVVNPKEKLVIVQWSAWPEAEPSFDAQPLEASLMFNAIANRLAK